MSQRHPDELTADFRRFYGVQDWRDLAPLSAGALCVAMIQQPESWVHRAMNPDWMWGDPARQAQALATDYLATLVWFKTKDGAKGRNQPKPFPRPGVKGYHTPGSASAKNDGVDMDELDRRLAAARVEAN